MNSLRHCPRRGVAGACAGRPDATWQHPQLSQKPAGPLGHWQVPPRAPKSPPCWAPWPVCTCRRAQGQPGRPCPCWRRPWVREGSAGPAAARRPRPFRFCLFWIGLARGLFASLGSWLGQSRPGQVRSGQVRYLTWPKSRTMRVARQLASGPLGRIISIMIDEQATLNGTRPDSPAGATPAASPSGGG